MDVFISYRRGTSTPYAGRLRDVLADRLGDSHVFMDLDSILPGTEWDKAIHESVRHCDVLIAVIGRGWATVHDAQNRPRLEDPNDFVRLEIEAALAAGVPVIPVLLHGLRMPRPERLPDSLKDLTRRQALTVRDDSWRSDVARLLEAIERHRRTAVVSREEPVATAANEPEPEPSTTQEPDVVEEAATPEPSVVSADAPPTTTDVPEAGPGFSELEYLAEITRRLAAAGYENLGPSGCPAASLVALKRVGVGQQTIGLAARAIREKSAKRLLGAYTGESLELAIIVGEFPSLSGFELAGFLQQAEACASSLLQRKGTRMKGAYFAISVAVTRRPADAVIEVATRKPKIQKKGASAFPVIVDLEAGRMHYFRERSLMWVYLSAIQRVPEELLSPSG